MALHGGQPLRRSRVGDSIDALNRLVAAAVRKITAADFADGFGSSDEMSANSTELIKSAIRDRKLSGSDGTVRIRGNSIFARSSPTGEDDSASSVREHYSRKWEEPEFRKPDEPDGIVKPPPQKPLKIEETDRIFGSTGYDSNILGVAGDDFVEPVGLDDLSIKACEGDDYCDLSGTGKLAVVVKGSDAIDGESIGPPVFDVTHVFRDFITVSDDDDFQKYLPGHDYADISDAATLKYPHAVVPSDAIDIEDAAELPYIVLGSDVISWRDPSTVLKSPLYFRQYATRGTLLSAATVLRSPLYLAASSRGQLSDSLTQIRRTPEVVAGSDLVSLRSELTSITGGITLSGLRNGSFEEPIDGEWVISSSSGQSYAQRTDSWVHDGDWSLHIYGETFGDILWVEQAVAAPETGAYLVKCWIYIPADNFGTGLYVGKENINDREFYGSDVEFGKRDISEWVEMSLTTPVLSAGDVVYVRALTLCWGDTQPNIYVDNVTFTLV